MVVRSWPRLPREAADAKSLEVFRTRSDGAEQPCLVKPVPACSKGDGTRQSLRSLLLLTSLWFCDSMRMQYALPSSVIWPQINFLTSIVCYIHFFFFFNLWWKVCSNTINSNSNFLKSISDLIPILICKQPNTVLPQWHDTATWSNLFSLWASEQNLPDCSHWHVLDNSPSVAISSCCSRCFEAVVKLSLETCL